MIRQRQGIWKAASYAVSLLILGYIALLMIYVSGSNRSFFRDGEFHGESH